MMTLDQCSPMDQSFTHVTLDNELTIFNTSAIDRHLRHKLVTPEWIKIIREQVETVVKNHGVEPEHMKRLNDDCLSRPCIFVEWRDGTHILVDGNHRLVYAHLRKKKEILGWLVKQQVWKDFTIKVPPEMNLRDYIKAATGRIIPNDVIINVGRY